MLYHLFGKMLWEISSIGQGCWNIGNQWKILSDAEVENIIFTAYECGINIFDVAESYGNPNGLSEIRLGNALKKIRPHVFIVSKIGNWGLRSGQGIPRTTTDMIRISGHACLGRLQTSWIDVMLCHDGNIKNPEIYIQGFELLKKEGFIREYGISTDNLETLKTFYNMSNGNCKVVELEYSLLNRLAENELLPYCQEKELGVLVKRPLASGILSGKYTKNTIFNDIARGTWNINQSERKFFEDKLMLLEEINTLTPSNSDLITEAFKLISSYPKKLIPIPGATSPEQVKFNVQAIKKLLQ